MPSSSKIHLTIIVNRCKFNSLFNGKLSSVLNLIFIKSLPYSPFLPPFIVSISFLIPSQSSVYFFNTSYFSSAESKTKYLLPFFTSIFFFFFSFFLRSMQLQLNRVALNMSIYFTSHQMQRIYTVNIFAIINLF